MYNFSLKISNFSAREAYDLMLEGKKITIGDNSNEIYYFDFDKNFICSKISDNIYYHKLVNFLAINKLFKIYEEKNEPRKYTFETYIGEDFGAMPFEKSPIEVALKHRCLGLNDDYNNLKSMYKKVSKVKVTLEFIDKEDSDFVFPEIPFRRK